MTRQFVSCAAAVCVCSALALAQTPPPPPATGSSHIPSTTADRVTVSGCLERADQMQPPGATTTVDSLSFVLIKGAPARVTGTAGSIDTANDAAGTGSDRMYRLDGPIAELNLHVGQKVEVTGTVAEASTAPAGAGSPTNVPRLKVEQVTVLDTTCPR